jgi:peptide/nickel transport system ATP-binding protein
LARPSVNQRLKRLPTVSDILKDHVQKSIVSPKERSKSHKLLYAKPPILEVIDVNKIYISKVGWFSKPSTFNAVKDVSFKVYPGETLGLVGESGCGKSTLSNAIMQLDPATSGQIKFNGKDITQLKRNELRALRKEIQIIFQDPYASLNPRLTIANTLIEPMTVHGIGGSSKERYNMAIDILNEVGLDSNSMNKYPHEFSGGQRQRIGIARAIVLKPKLIICDESVSALDISVQAQVLNLLNTLKESHGFTYIFISHDLGVVKCMSDQLLVMNNGSIEELGDADFVYNNPTKAYTKKLIHAIPKWS